MDTGTKPPTRFVSVKCFRYSLDAINVLQVVIACLTIIGAISIKALFREYHFTSWYSALHSLPNLWIAIGCFLIIFSVFGVFATIKNSCKLINLYAVSIIIVFILQMAAAITGFTLLPQAGGIVRGSLNSMMEGYEYSFRYRTTMDWIQESFGCCGNSSPSDWDTILTNPPHSCCPFNSDFDHCDRYSSHERGCHSFLYDMVFRCILIIASSALVVGLLQIWGIMCAFMLASRVRQEKTERDVQKWTADLVVDKQGGLETKILEEKQGDINYI
ncbi:hypothetical protein HA402_004518 [Bradysia odoriphaga]|nr:hypothetical protein HA402_004518 [Bradysia odoriphaga]